MEEKTDTCRCGQPTARERIMEAALKVFARHGYEDASTREITEAAGANVASINYYFGGKENLFTELVRARAEECQRIRMEAVKDAAAQGLGLKQVLRAFVHTHLSRACREEGPEHDMALFFNILTSGGGPGFEIVMKEMIRPTHKLLSELFIENFEGMTRARATLAIGSLMGQIVHFIRNRNFISTISDTGFTVEELCDHITDLTYHGLEGVAHHAPLEEREVKL